MMNFMVLFILLLFFFVLIIISFFFFLPQSRETCENVARHEKGPKLRENCRQWGSITHPQTEVAFLPLLEICIPLRPHAISKAKCLLRTGVLGGASNFFSHAFSVGVSLETETGSYKSLFLLNSGYFSLENKGSSVLSSGSLKAL